MREVLQALYAKECLKIEERSRSGHLIFVLLPSEIPGLTRQPPSPVEIDVETLDFFTGRRYLSSLLARDSFACFYCLRRLTAETCELDHLVPQAEKLDNSFKNVVCACHSCNKAKGSQQAESFLRTRYRANLLSEEELHSRLAALEASRSSSPSSVSDLIPSIDASPKAQLCRPSI